MTLKFHKPYNHVNMMSKGIITATLLLLSSAQMMAQNNSSLNGESEYMYNDMMQMWRGTENSSGLTIDSACNRGYAEFSFDRREGDLHRVQEGSSMNQFVFFTERYQHIGKYLYGYGKFKFDEGRTKDRAWSDVMRTYFSNPFFSGSDVPGKYDHQDFDLTARVGTVDFDGWRFGLGLEYKVGDLSRLRDPRSRNRLLDYKLTPSVSYSMGNSTVGLAGYYNRRKEKMLNLTTVQNNPNLYYYQMTGLNAVTGSVGGYSGFSREYVDHAFGAELQYGYKGEKYASVNVINIEKSTDNIYEQYLRTPGVYTTYQYGFASQNRIIGNTTVHQIDLNATYQQGYADENRPQLVITTDEETGYKSYHYENLLTYNKRYQYKALDIDIHYRLNFTEGNAVKSYIGVEGLISNKSQKHLLPTTTFDWNTTFMNVEYGQALLKDNRLWITLDLGYLFSNKAELCGMNKEYGSLADNSKQDYDPEAGYYVNVLNKDMDYYSSDYFRGKLSVKYHFPLTIKKTKNLFYLKAFYETLKAKHSLDASYMGFAIGINN